MQLSHSDLQVYRLLTDPLVGEGPGEYFRRQRDTLAVQDVGNAELIRLCNVRRQADYVEGLVERLKAKDAGTLDALVEAVVLLLNTQYKP